MNKISLLRKYLKIRKNPSEISAKDIYQSDQVIENT